MKAHSSMVVSYSTPTSNHNDMGLLVGLDEVVSYSTPTSNHNRSRSQAKARAVVSYSTPTSNHNLGAQSYYISCHYGKIAHKKRCENQGSDLYVKELKRKIAIFQNSSNWSGASFDAFCFLPQRFIISPYCLSVTAMMLTIPASGTKDFTRVT